MIFWRNICIFMCKVDELTTDLCEIASFLRQRCIFRCLLRMLYQVAMFEISTSLVGMSAVCRRLFLSHCPRSAMLQTAAWVIFHLFTIVLEPAIVCSTHMPKHVLFSCCRFFLIVDRISCYHAVFSFHYFLPVSLSIHFLTQHTYALCFVYRLHLFFIE
jgi:hypothetical protein